jgi:hypothetical protein
MIAALALFTFLFGVLFGALLGHNAAAKRTKDALKLARYNDAIALADDLVKTPDALDLRPRAQKILAAHRAATPRETH